MKTFKPIVIMVWIAVLATGGWFVMAQQQNHHEQGHKEIYYCPMHPYYTSDRPGICPICNMNLVKRKTPSEALQSAKAQPSGSPEGYASVDLSGTQQQLIGIKTVEAVKKPLMKTVRAYGAVTHDVDLYKVQNEFIDAYIDYINIYRDYKRVIDRRRSWEAHRETQVKALEAEHKLLLLGLSESQIEILRHIDRWQIWNQPELLFVKSSNNYWIYAQIFEDDLGYVDVGQKANIEIPSYKEKMTGIVRSIGGAVDPESRTIRILIELPDYKGELAIGMLADVQMQVELGGNLQVPKEAVMDLGNRKIVFVAEKEGVFKPVEVEIGAHGDGYYAVEQGLKEGERVVVDGNFLLDSESRLRSSFKNAAEGGQGHVH